MNSKDCVLTALNHEEPDQVPLEIWLPPQASQKLRGMLALRAEEGPHAFYKRLGYWAFNQFKRYPILV
jgi:hypothetical protein